MHMPIKEAIKNLFHSVVLSGPVYEHLKSRALAEDPTHVLDACEQLESVSPRPQNIRAKLTPLPEASLDISVIIPVYNVEKYVGSCLESVLSQQLDASFEVIVVIDGSQDGSEEIVRSFSDSRLRVICQKNGGLSSARNTGIAHAHGRWLAFVDSDDMLASGHLAALYERAQVGDCDIVGSLWRSMSEDGAVGKLGESQRTNMAPWGRLYRREVWERLRFPVGCWYEDLITPCCIDSLFHEEDISDAGYLYRSRPGSIVETSSSNPKALDAFWAMQEMISWRHDLGIVYGQQDWDRFIWLLGPLLMGRTTFLTNSERKALFSACCDLMASLEELQGVQTTRKGAWRDLERALREYCYELWCLACTALVKEAGSIKLTTAWHIYREARSEQ